MDKFKSGDYILFQTIFKGQLAILSKTQEGYLQYKVIKNPNNETNIDFVGTIYAFYGLNNQIKNLGSNNICNILYGSNK